MDEKPTYIMRRPEELAEIIRAGQAGDTSPLENFMQDPFAVIAQATIEFFSHGPVALVGPAVRVVQGALKGRLFQQFAKEISDLREKGKIDENFGEKKYGFQSWVELLTRIDEDSPDEDRLEALKAMFYSINKVNATDGEKILGYQLFQIAKRLTSNELLVLKSVHELLARKAFVAGSPQGFTVWAELIAKHLGHGVISLIEHADEALVVNQLLSGRTYSDRGGVQGYQCGRLTDLGARFCENIERYRIDQSS